MWNCVFYFLYFLIIVERRTLFSYWSSEFLSSVFSMRYMKELSVEHMSNYKISYTSSYWAHNSRKGKPSYQLILVSIKEPARSGSIDKIKNLRAKLPLWGKPRWSARSLALLSRCQQPRLHLQAKGFSTMRAKIIICRFFDKMWIYLYLFNSHTKRGLETLLYGARATHQCPSKLNGGKIESQGNLSQKWYPSRKTTGSFRLPTVAEYFSKKEYVPVFHTNPKYRWSFYRRAWVTIGITFERE